MANCIIAFPNYVDATYYSVAFSGGSWQAAMPLTNLRDRLLVKVARSTNDDLASTIVIVDLGAPRDVRVIAIPSHNMSRDALIRVRGASDSGFSNVLLDTGWQDVWRVIYPFGSLPFGHPSFWDGKITEEDRQGYPMPFVYVASSTVNARYWKFEINDTSNADGYVELSRLFLAPGWQPDVNMAYGNQLGWETETLVEGSLGGARFYDGRNSRRVWKFSINNLTVDDALSWPFEIQRKQGIDGQVFFVFDPEDTTHLHRRAFLATIRQLSPLEFPYHNRNNAAFELEEVIA